MSVYDEIQTAAVIRYPYLWSREAGKGETEGRKDRPVAVGVRIARADGDLVLFFPITSKQRSAAALHSKSRRSKSAVPVSTPTASSGSSWTSLTATSSATRFISNQSHRSVGSARPSSCRSCANSSRAANPSPRSAAIAEMAGLL